MLHPAELTPALSQAIAATADAGWQMPLSVSRSTAPGHRDAFDVEEADGTRVAIVGTQADACLIAAALNYVLAE